jgi:hypothetical protein
MRNTLIDLGPLSRPVVYPSSGATNSSGPITANDVARFNGQVVYCVDAPAPPVGNLPNGESFTYNLVTSNDPTFSSIISTTLMGKQTGAGGVGAAAQTFAAKVPPTGSVGKFVGFQIVASGSAVGSGSANGYLAAY